MSALRVICHACAERTMHPHAVIVDLGWGSARGTVHDGGRLAPIAGQLVRGSFLTPTQAYRERKAGRA